MIPTYAVPTSADTTVLTAGKADQFAGPLPDGDRPAFSYLLLGALRGWGDADGDGTVSAAEAVEYSQGALTALLTDRRQTPQLYGAGDLALGGGTEAGPDLIAMVTGSPTTEAEPTVHPQQPVTGDVGIVVPGVLRIGEPFDLTRLGPATGAWTRQRADARDALQDMPSSTARILAIKDFAGQGLSTRSEIRSSFGPPHHKKGGYWHYGDAAGRGDDAVCEGCRGALTVGFDPSDSRQVLSVTVRGEPGLLALLKDAGGSSWPPLGILRATPAEVQALLGKPDKIVTGRMWSYAGTGVSFTFGQGPDGPVVEYISIDPR